MAYPDLSKASSTESQQIVDIMLRAASLMNFEHLDSSRLDVVMDLTACHLYGCTMDLAGLLAADPQDLIHDITGILRHIDRRSGQLAGFFLPRYAACQHEEVPREVLVRQWFHTGLSEKEGQALVGHVQGTKKYNLLVPYNDLPEQAKAIVRAKYEETVRA
jgi:hypothetical protein